MLAAHHADPHTFAKYNVNDARETRISILGATAIPRKFPRPRNIIRRQTTEETIGSAKIAARRSVCAERNESSPRTEKESGKINAVLSARSIKLFIPRRLAPSDPGSSEIARLTEVWTRAGNFSLRENNNGERSNRAEADARARLFSFSRHGTDLK